MSYLMQIIETEAQPVLSVKATTSLREMPELVGRVYGEIFRHILSQGEEPLGPAFIAYYGVDKMDMENLIVEIGFPVARELPGKGEIQPRQIPPGRKAMGYHKGAYGEISPVYEKLKSFIREKGYERTGVVYEHYFNAPEQIPESELLTKVEFLLK